MSSILLVAVLLAGLAAPAALPAERGTRHHDVLDSDDEGDDGEALDDEPMVPSPPGYEEGDEPDVPPGSRVEPRRGSPSLPGEENDEPSPSPDVPPLDSGPAEPASAALPQGVDKAP